MTAEQLNTQEIETEQASNLEKAVEEINGLIDEYPDDKKGLEIIVEEISKIPMIHDFNVMLAIINESIPNNPRLRSTIKPILHRLLFSEDTTAARFDAVRSGSKNPKD